MKGKERCRILKEIRQRIADENGIEFVTSECKHKGDCRGTCPKCESEVIYLERELAKRQRLGKSIAVAGIAATMVFSATACTDPDPVELGGDVPYVENETDGIIAEPPENDETDDGELIAAITAAISLMLESEGKDPRGFRVVSFRRSSSRK